MAVQPGWEASARESCPKNECCDAVGMESESLSPLQEVAVQGT